LLLWTKKRILLIVAIGILLLLGLYIINEIYLIPDSNTIDVQIQQVAEVDDTPPDPNAIDDTPPDLTMPEDAPTLPSGSAEEIIVDDTPPDLTVP